MRKTTRKVAQGFREPIECFQLFHYTKEVEKHCSRKTNPSRKKSYRKIFIIIITTGIKLDNGLMLKEIPKLQKLVFSTINVYEFGKKQSCPPVFLPLKCTRIVPEAQKRLIDPIVQNNQFCLLEKLYNYKQPSPWPKYLDVFQTLKQLTRKWRITRNVVQNMNHPI